MTIGPNQTTGSLIGRILEIKRNIKIQNAFILDIDQTFVFYSKQFKKQLI